MSDSFGKVGWTDAYVSMYYVNVCTVLCLVLLHIDSKPCYKSNCLPLANQLLAFMSWNNQMFASSELEKYIQVDTERDCLGLCH